MFHELGVERRAFTAALADALNKTAMNKSEVQNSLKKKDTAKTSLETFSQQGKDLGGVLPQIVPLNITKSLEKGIH